jgi:hypothetical protein
MDDVGCTGELALAHVPRRACPDPDVRVGSMASTLLPPKLSDASSIKFFRMREVYSASDEKESRVAWGSSPVFPGGRSTPP